MSWKRVKQRLIQLIPISSLRKFISFHYGWFPTNYVSIKAKISDIRNLVLDGNVYIGDDVHLRCGRGIHIGKNVAIAEGVYMITTNHSFRNCKKLPFDDKSFSYTIDIGPNCWIGAKSLICPVVKLEEGVVVAAGSVVTKSVPKCAIVGGNPAKIIGYRDIANYENNVLQNNVYHMEPQTLIVIDKFKDYLEG